MATTRYGDIRARDTDRADVCGLLDAALADGQLTEDEHTARTAKAMSAKSFGELDAIVGDLQIPDNLVDAPVVRVDRRRPRRWLAPVAIISAAAVLGAAVGGIASCAGGSVGPSEHVPTLTTGAGLAYFLAAYRAEFGDTKADEVTLYPEYVLFKRPVSGNPSETASYYYNGSIREPDIRDGRSPDTKTFDLAAVDVRAIAGLLAGAPQTIKVPDGSVSYFKLSSATNGPVDLGPAVEIYAKSRAGASGFMTVTFTGEPLRVASPTPR
ncbi:DUF1707 SHOCT-like domain-containing protein [Nocardia sp. CA-135953]|uniref:DUF1707 SHOCT-like domain-containing protein n=1 Tax=Nocardia sp. CA-135953 TaxID=3239978 RepID=UPI003D978E52